jgi:hypothetical protein
MGLNIIADGVRLKRENPFSLIFVGGRSAV